MDAGADLATFLGGTGEVLRALLMLQLGAEPGELTEAMRAVLERERDALRRRATCSGCCGCSPKWSPASAAAASRGSWSRRCCCAGRCWTGWSDLQEVLAGGPPRRGADSPAAPAARATSPAAGRASAPRAPVALRDSAPVAARNAEPPPPPGSGPWRRDRLHPGGAPGRLGEAPRGRRGPRAGSWARRWRPPGWQSVAAPDVTIQVPADNPMYGETLERAAEVAREGARRGVLGAPVRLRFAAAGRQCRGGAGAAVLRGRGPGRAARTAGEEGPRARGGGAGTRPGDRRVARVAGAEGRA